MEMEATGVVGKGVGGVEWERRRRRIQREVSLALRCGIRDACSEFSFLRVRGLHAILNLIQSILPSPSAISIFRHSQQSSSPLLQGNQFSTHRFIFHSMCGVVPVLFKNSLKQEADDQVISLYQIFSVDPVTVTSPSTDTEVAVALRVLEGCCLVHRGSTVLAHAHEGVKVLMKILSTRGPLVKMACLDALIAIMLHSSVNQMEFDTCNGIVEVAEMIRDKNLGENLRVKCGEFMLLLIGDVKGRERSALTKIYEDIRYLLGEKSASLIWAATQLGLPFNEDLKLASLSVQSRRVLDSLSL